MKITLKTLKTLNASLTQEAIFARLFPSGMEPTEENALAALKAGFDIDDLARRMSDSVSEAYEATERAAWKTFKAASKIEWAGYEVELAKAWAAYEAAKAAARDAYDAAIAPARHTYQTAIAKAFVAAMNAEAGEGKE